MLPLRDHSAYLDHYFHQGGHGGVFVAGNIHLDVGEEVDLEVSFSEEQAVFRAQGLVRWKRQSTRQDLPPGIGIEFAPWEKATRDKLLDFARGKSVVLTHRESRRFPIMVEVRYKSDSVFVTDVTDDLSEDGAFIVTDQLLEVGTQMELKWRLPGQLLPFKVKAKVVWQRPRERQGIGVRFVYEKKTQREKLRRQLARIKEQLIEDQKIHIATVDSTPPPPHDAAEGGGSDPAETARLRALAQADTVTPER
jgi:uncharacterized protein (TIGR02266 family)